MRPTFFLYFVGKKVGRKAYDANQHLTQVGNGLKQITQYVNYDGFMPPNTIGGKGFFGGIYPFNLA